MWEKEDYGKILSLFEGPERGRVKALLHGAAYGSEGSKRALNLMGITPERQKGGSMDLEEEKRRANTKLLNKYHKEKNEAMSKLDGMFTERYLDCDYNNEPERRRRLLLLL